MKNAGLKKHDFRDLTVSSNFFLNIYGGNYPTQTI